MPPVPEKAVRQMAMVAAIKGKLLSIPELEALYRAATEDLRLAYRIQFWLSVALGIACIYLMVRS
jgi:hypothetical protein